jgi:hypothetical protein
MLPETETRGSRARFLRSNRLDLRYFFGRDSGGTSPFAR